MRILVCGGRDFTDKDLLFKTLDEVSKQHPDDWLPTNVMIIHGGARGADLLADAWAVTNWCPTIEFKAEWDRWGPSAGPIRNQRMLDHGKPDIVVAFPGGAGTADMVARAEKAGVPVIKV